MVKPLSVYLVLTLGEILHLIYLQYRKPHDQTQTH